LPISIVGLAAAFLITGTLHAAQCVTAICSSDMWTMNCYGADTCTYQKYTGTGTNPCDSVPQCGCNRAGQEWFGDGCYCGAGYYGTLSCTSCPSGGDSTPSSNTDITDCYVSSGYGGTDTSGKWEYTRPCYYTN